jgi:hypothetical protein
LSWPLPGCTMIARSRAVQMQRYLVRLVSPVFCALALALPVAEPARAQAGAPLPDAPRLEFKAPPGCPDEATFRNWLAVIFKGVDRFDPSSPALLRVTIAKVPDGYRGTAEYTPPGGEPWPITEQPTDARCGAALYQKVAEDASMYFDLSRKAPAPADLSALPELPRPEAPPKPDTVSLPPPAPPPAPRPPRVVATPISPLQEFWDYMDLTIGLGGLAIVAVGYADNVAPGFGLGLEVIGMPPSWGGSMGLSLGLEFRGMPPARVTAREPADPAKAATKPGPVDVSTWTGLLVPCLRFAKYFSGCGVAQVGAIEAQGYVDHVRDVTAALGPRFGVEVPFAGRFVVFGFGEALFRTIGIEYAYTLPNIETPNAKPPNVVWKQPDVSGFFGVGLAVRFN